jgi:hypothetical protein
MNSAALLKRMIFYAFYALIIFAIAWLALMPWRRTPEGLLEVIYRSLLFYIGENIILYLLGIQKSWSDLTVTDFDSGKATMLGALGLNIDRVIFIFSPSTNSFGAGSAMLLGLALTKCFTKGGSYVAYPSAWQAYCLPTCAPHYLSRYWP